MLSFHVKVRPSPACLAPLTIGSPMKVPPEHHQDLDTTVARLIGMGAILDGPIR